MPPHEGETTDGDLLERLGDWADHEAWAECVRRYDRAIRRHVRSYRFGPAATEDLCQRIWIELARRMRGYRYDPGRRFRSWLGRLCRSRAVDHWRRRRAEEARAGASPPEGFDRVAIEEEPEGDASPGLPALLREAARVQEAVRRRVDARTWDVFWSIAVEDVPVREAAEAAGLSYAAAFAAQKRVRRMLREEAAGLESATRADAGARP
ncbi:sigma-70 family RNA polymerase sigma factor [Paludisphaera mucosa]|uniref:Sigma-70 family RNA polymerase sigma factor n=1 Tax=Paludisphaera mucosa TaxID=3030827 RepID=A0ABT6FKH9_9BACT|nr:sigma-70 family RNA polymerase sigma factor [Paludisphaera mucosa]MDG3008024.1 sigma-70 family RNA polymerase sigma factor [Paludisphaera mucosa]